VRDYTGTEEQKLWHALPPTWSVPTSGEACRITELTADDPEYLEVERNVRKSCAKSVKNICSVSDSLIYLLSLC